MINPFYINWCFSSVKEKSGFVWELLKFGDQKFNQRLLQLVCALSLAFVCADRSEVHCGSEIDDSNRHYIMQQETAAS